MTTPKILKDEELEQITRKVDGLRLQYDDCPNLTLLSQKEKDSKKLMDAFSDTLFSLRTSRQEVGTLKAENERLKEAIPCEKEVEIERVAYTQGFLDCEVLLAKKGIEDRNWNGDLSITKTMFENWLRSSLTQVDGENI